MKRMLFFVAMMIPVSHGFAVTYGEKVADADSASFFVDSRVESFRTVGPSEFPIKVTYSGYNWDTTGSSSQSATVTVDTPLAVETLGSATGEGIVLWTPHMAGMHTLKHICNGATQMVTVEIEGPKVEIVRRKDAGGNTFYCEIVSEPAGCAIYYTTDSSLPTTASERYDGPFVVDPIRGAIVHAMAVSDTGVESRPVAANFAPLGIEVVAAASSGEFKVDGRAGTGEDLPSEGAEELTFSNLWDGDADATVTIAQDGAAIFTGLSGEGVKTWSVDRNGRYVLTHMTYKNGVKGKVETAVFVVEGKEVPVSELTIDWGQSSFVYDGQPKEPVITVKDGATTLTKGTHYLVEYKDNVNVGMAKAIVKGIEPYVGEVSNTFEITDRIYENEDVVIEKTDDGWDVILTNDISKLRFADNLGEVKIHLNGYKVIAKDGDTHCVGDVAIDVFHVNEAGDPTQIFLINEVCETISSVKGGNGGNNANGGDGIVFEDDDRTGVGLFVGENVEVKGGTGSHGWYNDDTCSKPGGCGVVGVVISNRGVIAGGVGGAGRYTPGGCWRGWLDGSSGGIGVFGDIRANSGIVAGGNGGAGGDNVDDVGGFGGIGGVGVKGCVGENTGGIFGGKGGKCGGAGNTGPMGVPGVGGIGVSGFVNDNACVISGGDSGSWQWGDSLEGDAPNGGDGVQGEVLKNSGFICGGHAIAIDFDYWYGTETLAGTGGVGVVGFVNENNGVISGGTSFGYEIEKQGRGCDTAVTRGLGIVVLGGEFHAFPAVENMAYKGMGQEYSGCVPYSYFCRIVDSDVGVNAGSYQCTLGMYRYADYMSLANGEAEVELKWKIDPRSMELVQVELDEEQMYTGMAIEPTVVVSDGEPSIVKASDYTVSYADNVQPGTARIILTATAGGNYTGTKTVPFTIRKATFDIDDGMGGEGGAASKFSYAGVYDRQGHGINVQIADPPAGMVIKYSRGQPDKAPGGTWSTVNPLYTNVCDNVIWYAVECAGYISYTNNATVTITPKPLAVTADAKTQIYGKAAKPLTYTTVGLCSGDALTGALTRVPGDDAGEYDILQGTLANANYTISFTGAKYTITKGTIPGGGEEPGSGEIPEEGLSKFDATYMYDGEGHTIKTNELVAAFRTTIGDDFTVSYAAGESGGLGQPALPWTAVAPVYTNVGEYVVWYKVSSANYEDFVHQAKVAITNRTMAYVTVGAIGEQIFTGLAIEPTVVVSDGEPSIITAGDYTVSYADNIQPGTAKAIVSATAGGNYTGTKTVPFTIRKTTFDIDDGTGGEGGKSSKFSYSGVYDGQGHGINVKVENPPAGMVIKYSRGQPDKAPGGTWSTENPLYTDVCDNVVWYALECAGYISYTNNATVTITAKPLAVTADAKTQVYGEAAKPLTYTTVGLCSGDALTGALTREPGEDVGEYDILQGTLANGNYAISYTGAKYTITKGTIPGGGEEPGAGEIPEGGLSKFDAVRVYNGKGQTIDVEKLKEAFAEVIGDDFTISFAVGENGGFIETALPPTEGWGEAAPTIKDIGELVMWYKVMSPNYEDYVHQAKVTVVEKVITDEMVQPGEDAFFFDGDDKKPTVDVQYFVDGKDICTENDYTLTYGTKAGAGWWVTVTGKGNYSGTVTKIVPVLKRPVAPPVITSKSYTGKLQKPTIPTDSRWTVVANPGGINVGEYPNVVLRLTNTTDYKWKGGAEDQTDITLVFKVTKGNNGWSRQPDMKGWAYGETPNEPSMGQARYGTVKVAYRKAGADVSTETATRPELPGKYIARFWVDETENFIGVAVHEPYKDIAFEITGSAPGGTETTTTPVPVPHVWLDAYVTEFGGGDYETAANAKGKNGVSLWESYVAGLDPTDPTSQFKAIITVGADGKPVITWEPDMSKADPPRVYVEYGKANLGDKDWMPVTDANRSAMHFFKVGVEIK